MSFGDIDTLNLLFDKLQNLLNDTQGYYESFLDANTMYKQGKLTDKEFFEKLGDYVVSYSSLEFLSVKVIFELKKSLDKISSGRTSGSTMASPMPPGMGPQSSQVTAATLPGLGQPPSIISAATDFLNTWCFTTTRSSTYAKTKFVKWSYVQFLWVCCKS